GGQVLIGGETLGAAPQSGSVDLMLQRLNADGSVDTTFGNGGTVRTDVAGRDDVAVKVLPQPDGRIIVVGYEQRPFLPGVLQSPDVFIARYEPDGRPDPSFGNGGVVVTHVPGYQAATAASA